MKKLLLLAVMLTAIGAFSIARPADASLFPYSPEQYHVVASSSAGTGDTLLWIGQGDGATVLGKITMSVWSDDPTATAFVRYTCFSSMATSSSPAPSQSGCTNTSAVNSDTISIYQTGTIISGAKDFTFSSSVPLQAGKWYLVELQTVGSYYEVFGKETYDVPYQTYYNGSQCVGCKGGTPMWVANATFTFTNPTASATSSSLFSGFDATTTLQALANQCSQAGNIFAEGLCTAGAFLFIPSPQVLEQYANLAYTASSRIPFSYVASIKTAIESISIDSQAHFPLISIPLSSVASSTLTGVLPDLTLSTSTISTYLSDSARNTLKLILTALIWLAVGWLLFFEAMHALKPKHA